MAPQADAHARPPRTRPFAQEGGGASIRVYVRVRPPSQREQRRPGAAAKPAVVVDQAADSVVLHSDRARRFTFDGVWGEEATQEGVFKLVGRGIADNFVRGYNVSLYVYGQTGAGKTHTMFGPVFSLQDMQTGGQRGLSCRVLDEVFHQMASDKGRADGVTYSCQCSLLEIYKEQITDLLKPGNTNLQVREDSARGVYVDRLSEPSVGSLEDVYGVLKHGLEERRTGETHMNEKSSRSHAVFTLSIVATSKAAAAVRATLAARLSLIDLAGSERQQGVLDLARASSVSAATQSLRVREAGAINKSLSALTNVIMSLSEHEKALRGGGPKPVKPCFARYRDSKLTYLLRDSLGGNSKTTIVANVSPSASCAVETLSTLKFAAKAKFIRCAAVQNEDVSGSVEGLVNEVKLLRQQLVELRSANGSLESCAAHEAELRRKLEKQLGEKSDKLVKLGLELEAARTDAAVQRQQSDPASPEGKPQAELASTGPPSLAGDDEAGAAPREPLAAAEAESSSVRTSGSQDLDVQIAELDACPPGPLRECLAYRHEPSVSQAAPAPSRAQAHSSPGHSASSPAPAWRLPNRPSSQEDLQAALSLLPSWVLADLLGRPVDGTALGSTASQNLQQLGSAVDLVTRRVQLSNGEYYYWQSGAGPRDAQQHQGQEGCHSQAWPVEPLTSPALRTQHAPPPATRCARGYPGGVRASQALQRSSSAAELSSGFGTASRMRPAQGSCHFTPAQRQLRPARAAPPASPGGHAAAVGAPARGRERGLRGMVRSPSAGSIGSHQARVLGVRPQSPPRPAATRLGHGQSMGRLLSPTRRW